MVGLEIGSAKNLREERSSISEDCVEKLTQKRECTHYTVT